MLNVSLGDLSSSRRQAIASSCQQQLFSETGVTRVEKLATRRCPSSNVARTCRCDGGGDGQLVFGPSSRQRVTSGKEDRLLIRLMSRLPQVHCEIRFCWKLFAKALFFAIFLNPDVCCNTHIRVVTRINFDFRKQDREKGESK